MYKIIIWGLGRKYNRYVGTLQSMEKADQIEIVGVTCRDVPDLLCIDGWEIIQCNNIYTIEFDYIIVMSDNFFVDILTYIKDQGISEERVLSYKCLNFHPISLDKYIQIKNSKITIFSNNCWGGILYSSLGLECLSPFKNLFIQDEDYLKFLEEPNLYINCELESLYYETDVNSGKKYPVMCFGNSDIKLHFNHSDTFEQAQEGWNRRKQRINWENLLIEMYTEDSNTAERFLHYIQYEKKLLFVPEKIDIDGAIKLPLYPGQKKFYEAVNRSVSDSGYMYNLLDLMLGKVSYRII